jgi:hypothetical protein
LLEHPGIGLIVGREGDQTVLMGRGGTRLIIKVGPSERSEESQSRETETPRYAQGENWQPSPYLEHPSKVQGNDPLCGLDDPDAAASELAQLTAYPHSGDLILLGAWDSDGSVVTFEEQFGSHGGLGGPQDRPFIIHPSAVSLDSRALGSPCDLYVHFMANYVTRNT